MVHKVLILGLAMAFYWFMKRRAQFAEHLQTSNTGLTTGRYFRLMALAVTEILLGNGIGAYILGMNRCSSIVGLFAHP